MAHSHTHSHACGHEDDEHLDPNEGEQNFLYQYIDRDHVEALNESTPNSGKSIIKPWDRRLDTTDFLESDVDPQLILRVPFTGAVKLRSIIIRAEGGGQCPDSLKIYANAANLDFQDLEEREPTQKISIAVASQPIEYTVRAAKFPSVQSLTLFFPDNLGADTTKIYFVGFKGEFSQVTGELGQIVYEAQANPADHAKIPGTDSMLHSSSRGY